MNVTTKSKYAVRALVELAQRSADVPVPLVVLAESRGVPPQFLEQLSKFLLCLWVHLLESSVLSW